MSLEPSPPSNSESKPGLIVDLIEGFQAKRQFSRLLDEAFSVKAETHFFDDFPIWDETFSPPELARIGIFSKSDHETKLVSCAGVRLATMKAGAREFKVGLIGAVATHPDFRAQGLASKTVSFAMSWAQDRGASALFLWGSEYALYQKMGFELCGEQIRKKLAELSLVKNSTPIQRGWNSALLPLLQKRSFGLKLETHDLRWLSAHRSVDWFWSGEEKAPTAYVAIGRGIDLQNLVHEWSGEAADLRSLLAHVLAQNPQAELLGSPGLFRDFGFDFDPATVEFLCLCKVLDPVKIFSAVHPAIPFRAKPTRSELLTEWSLQFGNSKPVSMSEHQLARTFFGPATPVSGPQGQIVPLPLWIWGLDGA